MKAWYFSNLSRTLRFDDGRPISYGITHSYPPPIPPPPLPIDLTQYMTYGDESDSVGHHHTPTDTEESRQKAALAKYMQEYTSKILATNPQYQDLGIGLCSHGMHGSTYILDALYYAPSPIVWYVELQEPVISTMDKSVSRSRTYLTHGNDISNILRQYMIRLLQDNSVTWEVPDKINKYITSGNDAMRQDAYDTASNFYSMNIWETYGAKSVIQASSPSISAKIVRLCTFYSIASKILKNLNEKAKTPFISYTLEITSGASDTSPVPYVPSSVTPYQFTFNNTSYNINIDTPETSSVSLMNKIYSILQSNHINGYTFGYRNDGTLTIESNGSMGQGLQNKNIPFMQVKEVTDKRLFMSQSQIYLDQFSVIGKYFHDVIEQTILQEWDWAPSQISYPSPQGWFNSFPFLGNNSDSPTGLHSIHTLNYDARLADFNNQWLYYDSILSSMVLNSIV